MQLYVVYYPFSLDDGATSMRFYFSLADMLDGSRHEYAAAERRGVDERLLGDSAVVKLLSIPSKHVRLLREGKINEQGIAVSGEYAGSLDFQEQAADYVPFGGVPQLV